MKLVFSVHIPTKSMTNETKVGVEDPDSALADTNSSHTLIHRSMQLEGHIDNSQSKGAKNKSDDEV
jgi:hypothetical protein